MTMCLGATATATSMCKVGLARILGEVLEGDAYRVGSLQADVDNAVAAIQLGEAQGEPGAHADLVE